MSERVEEVENALLQKISRAVSLRSGSTVFYSMHYCVNYYRTIAIVVKLTIIILRVGGELVVEYLYY